PRNGRCRVVVSGTDKATGKRKKLTATFDTKKEAVIFRDELLRQQRLNGGILIDSGKQTVAGWLDEWLKVKKGKVEPATYAWNKRLARLNTKPILGNHLLSQFWPLDIERMHATLTEQGVSPSEQHKAATTLRNSLEFGLTCGRRDVHRGPVFVDVRGGFCRQ